jgi:hypothetical protein
VSSIDPQFAFDFTERFAPFLNPLPEVNSFREYLKFCPSDDKSGLQYSYPVQAAISHGQTADKSGTAFTINAARPGVELKAILDGTDLIVRETFPYSAMLKARNGVSLEGNAAAYWDPMDKVMMTTMRSMEHYNELMLMFGCGTGTTILSDIGVIGSVPVLAGTGPNYGSATHPIVQLSSASWAAGIWNNMGSGGGATSGALVDIYQSNGTTLRVADVQVEGVVDASLCQVQMFKSGDSTAVTAGDRIVPKGWLGNTSAGVEGILNNTGTFANISAATNPFWRARKANASAGFDANAFVNFASKLMPNGGNGSLTAFCNPVVFSLLVNGTMNSTRWLNSQDNVQEVKTQGANVLQFLTATGTVTLKRHEYMKQGQVWVLMDDEAIRVGASDITFRGANGNEGFFLELTNNAGSEIRAISQQAALLTCPYHNLLVTGITNSTYFDIAAGGN